MTRVLLSLACISFFLFSCADEAVESTPLPKVNVNYPALYVLNRDDLSISVVNTNTMQLAGIAKIDSSVSIPDSSLFRRPNSIALHPDGSKLIISCPTTLLDINQQGTNPVGGKVLILNAITAKRDTFFTVRNPNWMSRFSPDGREIWVSQSTAPGRLLVFSYPQLAQTNVFTTGSNLTDFAFSEDRNWLYVNSGADTSVSLIQPNVKELLLNADAGAGPISVWPSKDNRMFISNYLGRSISIFSVENRRLDRSISLDFNPMYAVFRRTGNELWVSNPLNGSVEIYLLAANSSNKIATIKTGAGCSQLIFDEQKDVIYALNRNDNSLSVLNCLSRSVMATVKTGAFPVSMVLR